MNSIQEPEKMHDYGLGLVVLVIGSLSLILGVVGDFSGLFLNPDLSMQTAVLRSLELEGSLRPVSPFFAYAYLATVAFGTSFVLLSVQSLWRGLLFLVVLMLLSCSLVLVLSLFDWWFSPLACLAAMTWAGLGSLYHLAHLKKKSEMPSPADEPEQNESVDEGVSPASVVDENDEWEKFRPSK